MTTKRSHLDTLRDIANASAKAEKFLAGVTFAAFQANDEKAFAVVRALEIVGEAAKKIPVDFQARHPEIPWKEMVGMRNKVIHEYFSVDLEVVWKTVKQDLPALRERVRNVIRELEQGEGDS